MESVCGKSCQCDDDQKTGEGALTEVSFFLRFLFSVALFLMTKIPSRISLGPLYFTQKRRCVVQSVFQQSTSLDVFSLQVVVNAIDDAVVLVQCIFMVCEHVD